MEPSEAIRKRLKAVRTILFRYPGSNAAATVNLCERLVNEWLSAQSYAEMLFSSEECHAQPHHGCLHSSR